MQGASPISHGVPGSDSHSSTSAPWEWRVGILRRQERHAATRHCRHRMNSGLSLRFVPCQTLDSLVYIAQTRFAAALPWKTSTTLGSKEANPRRAESRTEMRVIGPQSGLLFAMKVLETMAICPFFPVSELFFHALHDQRVCQQRRTAARLTMASIPLASHNQLSRPSTGSPHLWTPVLGSIAIQCDMRFTRPCCERVRPWHGNMMKALESWSSCWSALLNNRPS